jgi:putative acetyltransferase
VQDGRAARATFPSGFTWRSIARTASALWLPARHYGPLQAVSVAHPYPYLAQLFDAFFHQNEFREGKTDDDILRAFSDSSHPHDVLGTRADSLRFLREHGNDENFVASLYRYFQLELSTGATDADARAWLASVESLLRTRQVSRFGPDSGPMHAADPRMLKDARFALAQNGRFMMRWGGLGEHVAHSQVNLRLVSTDPSFLVDLLYGVSLRRDCWCVNYALGPRDGMYLGQLWLSSDGAVSGLYQELKGHPRLMVSIQNDVSLEDSRAMPLPGGSCRIWDDWPEHAAEVAEAHRQAFGRADEAAIVDAVRAAGAATVSLVAQLAHDQRRYEPGPIIGHVLLSPVTVDGRGEPRGLGLGPIAVLPQYQRRGVGSRLIEAALRRARALGHAFVVVLGHPEYYPRFGFKPASRFGLQFEHPVPDEVFLALELVPGGLQQASGVVRYLPAFSGE